ncbi:expressed unknown protein [Seminavis robusta]|uniref:Uncharacterized protein n=1 Tax=Seminavis robusta TaxID=568900 RepID=A0A9N8DRI0_9STRA|nr:expressed unknown protein [Seminavis robusta]|eukprot:Sro303_g112401.1  (103) ;mRNA; f:35429-35737
MSNDNVVRNFRASTIPCDQPGYPVTRIVVCGDFCFQIMGYHLIISICTRPSSVVLANEFSSSSSSSSSSLSSASLPMAMEWCEKLHNRALMMSKHAIQEGCE